MNLENLTEEQEGNLKHDCSDVIDRLTEKLAHKYEWMFHLRLETKSKHALLLPQEWKGTNEQTKSKAKMIIFFDTEGFSQKCLRDSVIELR